MTPPRVLVCEEDPALAGSITSVLEAAGFVALHVREARAAWDAAQAQPPDFALIDISPPQDDDMELARRLAHARVPFVVLSARDDAERVERAIEAGAMGCFFKPLDVSIIVPSIGAWIARASELRHLREEQQSLLEALRHHRGIGAAVGVIMERHGLTPDSAFEALRRQARRERKSVAKLASAIVEGTAALQPPAPSR